MIGPNDQRSKLTRCLACAKKKVKCQGGFPCVLCTRIGKLCIPPVPLNKQSLVIIHDAKSTAKRPSTTTTAGCAISIPSTILPPFTTRLAQYFFTEFLPGNSFLSTSLHLNLELDQLSQPVLQNAIIAVASLDASRRSLSFSTIEKRVTNQTAIKAYRRSVLSLQQDIQDGIVLKSDACLWSTFFLGIFELMYDSSGENWVKHILYGTSQILRLRGASAHLNGPGRSFFLTFRVFEICRSLIYNDSTFLAEAEWNIVTRAIWLSDDTDNVGWHPKETLFDLMIDCSSLSMRGHLLDHQNNDLSTKCLLNIANDGILLQSSLHSWSESSSSWQNTEFTSPSLPTSPRGNKNHLSTLLATIYQRTTLIFLSGIFDYRAHLFARILTPTLSSIEVQSHVTTILELVEYALERTSLVGVLFFFPLRVAGARSRSDDERRAILRMLMTIEKRNFVVAGAFVEDLRRLWGM